MGDQVEKVGPQTLIRLEDRRAKVVEAISRNPGCSGVWAPQAVDDGLLHVGAASAPRGPGRSFPAAASPATRRTLHPGRTEETAHRLFQLQGSQHAAVDAAQRPGPRGRSRNGSPARRALCRNPFAPDQNGPLASLAQWRPCPRRAALLAATKSGIESRNGAPGRLAIPPARRGSSSGGRPQAIFPTAQGRKQLPERRPTSPLLPTGVESLSRRGCGSPLRQAINPGTHTGSPAKASTGGQRLAQALRDCRVASRPHIRTTGPRLRRPANRSTSRSPHWKNADPPIGRNPKHGRCRLAEELLGSC